MLTVQWRRLPADCKAVIAEPLPRYCLCGRTTPCDRTPACAGFTGAEVTLHDTPLPPGLLRDLGEVGVHFNAAGTRVRVTSDVMTQLLGRESPRQFSISMPCRDLIRLLGLLREPADWIEFEAGGYFKDDAGEIVQIDGLVATWDQYDQWVDVIVCEWGWRGGNNPARGEFRLISLDSVDRRRVGAIRRFWAAGVRPVDLASYFFDAGITVAEALTMQRCPHEVDSVRRVLKTLCGLRA